MYSVLVNPVKTHNTVTYRPLYMLRQDYSQIDLSTPVRTSCLGEKVVLPAVGKLLTMGNWINRGWRRTEGWWEKQSLLVTSTASEMTTHQFCFSLKFFFWPACSALISVAWPEPGNVLGRPYNGKQLFNKWTCGDSLQTWSTMMKNLSLSSFACFFFFGFTACFTDICLWNLISYYYLRGQS